jgi:hypothetical protein
MTWNALDGAGNKLPSGIYLLNFIAGEVKHTVKMTLLK